MLKFEYCKPVNAKAVPTGPDWIHEIKYDGYRGRIVRDGKNVRLFSKSGLDWAWRFPCIVETALKIKQSQFIIDGEICVLDVQGVSDFDALHSNKHNDEAQLYAFDLVSNGGESATRCCSIARAGWISCCAATPKASSLHHSSADRLGPICLPRPVDCGLRVSFQSTGNDATVRARATGSK